jgi:hypothetical protein
VIWSVDFSRPGLGRPLGLLCDFATALLDAEMDAPVVAEIREVIAQSPVPATRCDLHVWRVGADKYACVAALATAADVTPDYFKQQLRIHEELVRIAVEVNHRPASGGLAP